MSLAKMAQLMGDVACGNVPKAAPIEAYEEAHIKAQGLLMRLAAPRTVEESNILITNCTIGFLAAFRKRIVAETLEAQSAADMQLAETLKKGPQA